MKKLLAISKRILKEITRDRVSIGMMMVAPIIMICLFYLVISQQSHDFKLGLINIKSTSTSFKIVLEEIQKADIQLSFFNEEKEGYQALDQKKVDGYLVFRNETLSLHLDGTQVSYAKMLKAKVMQAFIKQEMENRKDNMQEQIDRMKNSLPTHELEELQEAMKNKDRRKLKQLSQSFQGKKIQVPNLKSFQDQFASIPNEAEDYFTTVYDYGYEDFSLFNSLAPLLGTFGVFFMVFLVGGIAFLKERLSFTLNRSFATPMKGIQFVSGYFLSFAILIFIQSTLFLSIFLYAFDVYHQGSFFSLLIVLFFNNLHALAAGLLASCFIKSEFQLMQFGPTFIFPQMIFSGIFNLKDISPIFAVIEKLVPYHYGIDAFMKIGFKGKNLIDVQGDLWVMLGFTLAMIMINGFVLKKNLS